MLMHRMHGFNRIAQPLSFSENVHLPIVLNGWIIGDSGVILHTSNGGVNWIIQNQNVNHYLVNIFFLDKSNGWITAWYNNFNNGSIIYKTTNGGHNWNYSNYPDTNLFISSICFADFNIRIFRNLFSKW